MVRFSALGDIAMSLHALSTLRARLCSAHVGWLVEDRFASLLEGHPQIDRLHVYERSRSKLRLWGLARAVRKQKYEVVLDLQGNLKSGAAARFSGAARRIGFSGVYSREGNRFFLTEKLPSTRIHRVDGYIRLIDAAVGDGPNAFAVLPAQPQDHGGVVLHPFVSRFFANKSWPLDHYAALGDRLAERLGAPILISTGPGEREGSEAIVAAMKRPARIVEPQGLTGLRDLLAGARLVIGGDTGPIHIAAALGVPTLGLMGPTDPETLAPYGPRAAAINGGARCSPCASPFSISKLRWCPDPVCMRAITVDAAERAALELLE